ncbi:MAG: SocA family protein [Planctomycetaceae bacterium]|jgi:uncharacterized phage-associated protein|nr:SocA family protein [Planctomycetaceae bacterium]
MFWGSNKVESVEFAKFLIARAASVSEDEVWGKNVSLGITKLHKLLYICDGLLLALGFNLIDETPRAWNYGPVYPKIHTWVKNNPNVFTEKQECKPQALQKLEEINAQSLVDFVLKHYGTWAASSLSLWSHNPGGPWEFALERSGGVMNCAISKTDMKAYFQHYLKDEKDRN